MRGVYNRLAISLVEFIMIMPCMIFYITDSSYCKSSRQTIEFYLVLNNHNTHRNIRIRLLKNNINCDVYLLHVALKS